MRDTESLRNTERAPSLPGWFAQRRLPRIDWRAACIAALSSVAVHVAFIEVVLWQEGGHATHLPNSEGLGANLITADEEPTATLILIEDPGVGEAEENPLEKMASAGKVLQNLQLTIITPQPSLDIASDANDTQEAADESDAASADRQAQAALFGRYLGQIQARVERVWRRPRVSPGVDGFDCHIQLRQTRTGEVAEVTLLDCGSELNWQLSLVRAIEGASPLPAPPDPSVFAESLQLKFHSAGYDAGGSEEGFEPTRSASAGAQRITQ
jgi:hypothetical protein